MSMRRVISSIPNHLVPYQAINLGRRRLGSFILTSKSIQHMNIKKSLMMLVKVMADA